MKKTADRVLPLVDPERNSFWMHPGYLHGIEQAGGLPVVLPMTMEEASLKQLVETMDGFLFTSGQDVSPELYGEAKGAALRPMSSPAGRDGDQALGNGPGSRQALHGSAGASSC